MGTYRRALLKTFFFNTRGGSPHVLSPPEVPPIVLVSAEADDLLAFSREPQVWRDDGEDAVFGEHRKKARRDNVDAGKGQRLEDWRGAHSFWFAIASRAAASELPILIKHEFAPS